MESLAGVALVYAVFLGGMMSPGPDFLVVLRNSLGFSARTGIYTAAGIAAGLVIHIGYCVAGIGLLISQSILLFNLIKWLGAAYLIYMGVRALRSPGVALATTTDAPKDGKTAGQAFANGFVVNLFNPKATMFFLALFSQMIDPATPIAIQIAFGAGCVATAFVWFSLVAAVMGIGRVRQAYARASKWTDRIFGAFFIGLGAKLALARAG
ncbi:LysE family transporter [Inquilinus sp. CAU 1745]|uniref:LysE family transporter n=1 Tax=Inquilinus sp. CAU 1745 TaxID=3140369 RepID=UPI00325AB4EC